MMDLTALTNFLTVVQEGSFSGAARATKVPISTISKHVQDLERALGVRLLERTTRALRLTPEGALLVERGTRLSQDAHDLERLFSERSSEPQGRLRICTPQLFGQTFLGTITAELIAAYPLLEIEAVFRDGPVDLIEDGFDCAIIVGKLEASSLMARTFAHAPNQLFASPAWVAANRDQLKSPADLATTQCVTYASTNAKPMWQLQSTGDEEATVQIAPRLRLGGMLAVRDAVIAGAGVAMLPLFLASDAVQRGQLEQVLPDWNGPSVRLSLVWPGNRHLSPRIRVLIDAIAQRFAGQHLSTTPFAV
jgi:DNA-binding transcriptional LysR family regulator